MPRKAAKPLRRLKLISKMSKIIKNSKKNRSRHINPRRINRSMRMK